MKEVIYYMNVVFALFGALLIYCGTNNVPVTLGCFLMVGCICLTISEVK